MHGLAVALREHPELAIFLTLAAGFALGRLRIGSFRIGNVIGTLLAGVFIGQVGIEVAPIVKVVFFDLFLFATGYKVGPQFFRGLGRSALPQVALTVVLCVTSLFAAFAAAKLLGYDPGTAAGLLAGAFTESTVLGTAGETIQRLHLDDVAKQRLLTNLPVAYAVTYLVGTAFVVWLLSHLAPRLLRVDLRAEARKLEKEMSGGEEVGAPSPNRRWDQRAYLLAGAWEGKTVAALERRFAPERVFVDRIRRGTEISDATPESVLRDGDVISVTAWRTVLASGAELGVEVDDPKLLSLPIVALDVVVTHKEIDNRTLRDVAETYGRGVGLLRLIRGGEEIPFAAATRVNRGDLLRLVGTGRDVERAGAALGYIERPSSATDVVFLGAGIFIGGLLGMLSLSAGDVRLSLTASGGALIMGLVFGWLRSLRPTYGRIPEPALWVFDTIGLAVFIGSVGLTAGPGFIEGLKTTGPSLIFVGVGVAATSHLVALLFGRYVLKMNPVILLGACAGAGTMTAGLRAIQDEAQSKLPVLGYTVPYAVGNILLTAWGPVIVMLTR